VVKKKMLSIISPARDKSSGKPGFICGKFVRRKTDTRKQVRESDQASLLVND